MNNKLKKLLTILTLTCAIPLGASAQQTTSPQPTLGDVVNSINGLPNGIFNAIGGATLLDVVKAINSLHNYVYGVVNATTDTLLAQMYQPNPNIASTIAVNNSTPLADETVGQNADTMALTQVKSILLNRSTDQITNLATLGASDSYVQPASTISKLIPFASDSNSQMQTQIEAGNNIMNLNALISPTVYTTQQDDQAKNFVNLVGNTAQPLSDVTFSGLDKDEINRLTNLDVYNQYQVLLRSMVAQESVGLGNLYYLIAQRESQSGLGTQAGLVDSSGNPIADASNEEIKKYNANRRTSDPQWYNDMETASPATVQRETLFVLAEVQHQLYENNKLMERMLATMSVVELQNAQANRTQLQQATQAVKDQISNMKGTQ